MQIVRYRPFPFVGDMQNEINELFQRNWLAENDVSNSAISQWSPQVDVKEEAGKFIVTADLPGVDPKDIEVSLEHNVLTIKGHRKLELTTKEENYSRVERFSGAFCRQFTFPEYVNSEQIEATGKNGVLTILIPKKERHIVKKIEVKNLENNRQ
jgi:HSP20 family protein